MDQFKIINDTCGHTTGDELLQQLAQLLLGSVRHRDTLSRLGGDEFGMLFENCPLDKAIEIANNLLKTIEDFNFTWGDTTFTLGISIGVVPIDRSTTDIASAMSAADAACYMAKEKGRNRVQYYRPHDSEVSLRRGEMEWVSRLQSALQEGRFVLYRQEIRAMSQDSPIQVHNELLVRMLDPQGNVIPPMAFIPAAERYSLMSYIDEWVIENAFAAIGALGDDCGTFAINISGTSIADDRFLEFVRKQFKTHSMPAGRICWSNSFIEIS